MLCRTCEREISSNNRACPQCGTPRSRAAAAPKVLNNALALGAMGLGAIAAIAVVSAMTVPAPQPVASLRVAIAPPSSLAATAAFQESYGGRESWGRAVSGVVWKYVTSRANIRNSPTAQGSYVVGVLNPGQRVRGVMYRGVVDSNTFWFRLSDGRGYVSAVNLSDYAPGYNGGGGGGGYAPPPNRGPDVQSCYVETSSGNLRVRSSPAGRVVGGIPSGTRVRSYDQLRGSDGYMWVRVVPLDRRYPTGWVSREYVIC